MLVLLLTGTWLLTGVLVAKADPFAIAAGRAGTSFIGLAALAAARPATRRSSLDVLRERPGAATVLGALGVFGYSTASVLAIALVGTATTNVILSLLPCAVFLLGGALFRQWPGRTALVGTTLAVGGALAYGALDSQGGLGTRGHTTTDRIVLGILLALASVGCMALYAHYYNRLVGDSSSIVALPAVFGAGTAMLLVPAFSLGSLPQVSASAWGVLLLLGCGIYVPTYIIQHELLRLRGPLFTTSASLVVPFLVRLCTWALGRAVAPSPLVLALLAVCCIGVRLTLVPSDSSQPYPQAR
ncbi:DMT family transporter [Streptomyces sp. NPDC056160]|uniref:DMT family transporter n=1 Tax=Streptomyces sp. NPDC056160 TaxID=3345731 RepID=UPI0035E1DA04